MTIEQLKSNLKNQKWRLNNLYFVKDENGKRVKFKLRPVQEYLLDNLHTFNIILKSRQLGVTTFFCILYLDDVIFYEYDAGLIAHTRDDAVRIFDTKIKYAWDNMPQALKQEFQLDTENVRELSFKRGKQESSIYVGTSLRSHTVQRLHISELPAVDAKYPLKAKEIKEGAFNTVHKGNIITVEGTAEGNEGVFASICKEAEDFQKTGQELSIMDWKFFFFPWYKHPQYYLKGNFAIPTKLKEYFEKVEAETGVKLTQEQKNWYLKKKISMRDAMKKEFPSTPQEAFETSIEGAYYQREINRVLEENRICKVAHEPRFPVDTYWDLGTAKNRKDAMSITFVQDVGLEVHIIDFYGSTGEGFAHYAKVLQDKGYIYGRYYAPHDIQVKELGTGKTRLEAAADLKIHFDLIDDIGFADGIELARMIFSKCWFDEEKAHELVKALKAYRKQWDDKLERYSDNPLKNWACDPADSFRYLAVGHKDHRRLGYLDPEEEMLRKMNENAEGGDVDVLNPLGNI